MLSKLSNEIVTISNIGNPIDNDTYYEVLVSQVDQECKALTLNLLILHWHYMRFIKLGVHVVNNSVLWAQKTVCHLG